MEVTDIIKLNIRRAEKDLQYWKDVLVEVTDPAFEVEKPREFKPAPDVSQVRDPLAKSMADLVTPKQLGMIRALAREAGVDHDEECQQALRCRTEELSKKAASSFIDHLKSVNQSEAKRA